MGYAYRYYRINWTLSVGGARTHLRIGSGFLQRETTSRRELLMTSRATLGEVRIAVGEVCTNQGFKSLIPAKGVDGLFLFYQIGLNKERYKGLGIGSTFLEVNKRDTEQFEVLVAPKREQRRIAEILSTLDEAIEQTEALIAKHQQIKAGLMHDLFTRGVTPTATSAPPAIKPRPL